MSTQNSPEATQNTTQVATDQTQNAGQKTETTQASADVAKAIDSAPVKTVETPDAAAKVEQKFEIKASDGSPVDAATADKIASFAKEQGLSPAQAQAIYNRETAAVTAFSAEQEKQYNERKSQWVETLKNHKEIGGQHFEKNIQAAHIAMKQFATPEFIKTLEDTGLGNHPNLVEVFYNISKAMADDKYVPAGRPTDKKTLAAVMYDKN
jgi:hypothetical protein